MAFSGLLDFMDSSLHGLKRLITGFECIYCGGFLPLFHRSPVPICITCFRTMRRITGDTCSYCGMPLICEKEYCLSCRDRVYVHQGNRSLFLYKEKEQFMLDSFKFEGIKGWAVLFAALMMIEYRLRYTEHRIVPVPTSPSTMAKRGWGHMEEIARILAHEGFPLLAGTLKKKKGISQKLLGREDRLTNSGELYYLNNLEGISGQNILLIDDVYTTGSTLEACARLLRSCGAVSVQCLTLYRD